MAEFEVGELMAEDVVPELPEEIDEQIGDEIEEGHSSKMQLNRSVSCGSILQGNGMSRGRNLSRRVSFPTDDKLISGYNEPRNPWEQAHGTTTEDLIQAYTQACQTWNVRPITKLLLQLQEITDFTVRANSLTLKGEKLEMRVVETLESIFKRVQFITIDLEATNLDEDAGASLFDMIEYYESAVNVLVGFNKNLGNRGWQAAAHMMRKMSCLRLFDGHSVPLSIQASPFVGRALRLSNTLVTLHLENAMLSGRPLLLIVAALRMNTTLRELFLADNRFSSLDALQLANLLKFNRILQLLDIRNNPIQDLGLGHLCAGLMAQSGTSGLNGPTGGLQTLVLWNNQISHDGMIKLATALRYTISLSTLNLGQNVLGDDGILRLKEGLLQNHSLLRLGLVGTKLTDEGGVAIAEYLAESPRIIRLDLRNNDIKVAGLMALSLAFKINNSLLRLDIDKPNKKDALKELAAKQESLMNDMVTYAARNKQAALEKAQAAQQRQENARRAQLKEESGLRYMDMTNASTSSTTSAPVVEQASSNNSNNQSPDMKEKVQKFKGANIQSSSSIVTTVTPDTDDTPEDSPEFLPRSSVSYHQVAPVMLSNSEMAKRAAAAAKLKPVVEHHEETSPATEQEFVNATLSKIIDDAFQGAKEALSMQNQLEIDDKTPSEPNAKACDANDQEPAPSSPRIQVQSGIAFGKAILQEIENAANPPPDRQQRNFAPSRLSPTKHNQSTRVEQPSKNTTPGDVEVSPNQGNAKDTLHDFANEMSETVISNAGLQTSHTSNSDVSSNSEDAQSLDTICGEKETSKPEETAPVTQHAEQNTKFPTESNTEQHASGDYVPNLAVDTKMTPHSGSGPADDTSNGDEDAIRLLVAMATEPAPEENPSSQVTQPPDVTSTSESESVLEEVDDDIKALVAMATGGPTDSPVGETPPPPADVEQITVVTETPGNSQNSDVIMGTTVGMATTPTIALTKESESQPDTDDITTDESSGFETAAEDASILSGDLSPMVEDVMGVDPNLGAKLLTPDSGVVQFENVGAKGPFAPSEGQEIGGTQISDSESPRNENAEFLAQSADLEPETEVQQAQGDKISNMALDLGKNQGLEQQKLHDNFSEQNPAKFDEIGENSGENISTQGAAGASTGQETSQVLDSPCEVEVSHFDLTKFPSGD